MSRLPIGDLAPGQIARSNGIQLVGLNIGTGLEVNGGTLEVSAVGGIGPTGPTGPTGPSGPAGPAGPAGSGGSEALVTNGAKYLGALSMEERNDWMSRASAIIAPTLYIEPFGSVVVEAALCGTPAITTDYGGFVETVEHGKTGFRCSYLGEFVHAIKDVCNLDTKRIRKRAVEKYSIHNIKNDYQKYFDRLNLLWNDGWDTITTIS